MGYDYTLDFLRKHNPTVLLVKDCFKMGTVYKRVFTDPRECSTAQKIVNNVMRSLAVNYPDEYTNLRKAIRTWTDIATGEFTLHVGPAWSKMPGRPPGASTASKWSPIGQLDSNTVVRPLPGTGEYHYPHVIKDMDDLTKFMGMITELVIPEIKQVHVEFKDEGTDVDWFNQMLGDGGWIAHLNGPTTLILERP